MRKNSGILIFCAILILIMPLQGCELITNIFAAGFWVGIVLAVLIIGAVIWLVIKGMKKLR